MNFFADVSYQFKMKNTIQKTQRGKKDVMENCYPTEIKTILIMGVTSVAEKIFLIIIVT